MNEIKITTPLDTDTIKSLKCGDSVLITGFIYTARDAAHKRIIEAIKKGEKLPFDLKNSIIYYTGPSPARPGKIIGAAGPTTSYRMDDYTPILLESGLKGMIGKGDRSKKVIESIVKHQAIYFVAIGGTAALLSKKIVSSEIIAYPDLGTEAIRKLYVKDFPVYVAIDSYGNNIYTNNRYKQN